MDLSALCIGLFACIHLHQPDVQNNRAADAAWGGEARIKTCPGGVKLNNDQRDMNIGARADGETAHGTTVGTERQVRQGRICCKRVPLAT